MKSKLILTALALVVILVGAALGQSASPAAPKLVIAKTEHSFGEIKAGEELKHTFIIKNEGTADLVIKNVAPS
jgi:hypothetical protein